MSFIQAIKRQMRSVIQWENAQPHALFEQWTDNGDEIKNASQLIVGPGQGCVFVYEGKVKSMIIEAGKYSLETQNIPFWTTVKKVMNFFESDHKVGIYFFRLTEVVDQKWGTTSDIKYDDPVYNFPVALKAFGNFSYKLSNPQHFFTNIIGERVQVTTDEFRNIMMNRLIEPISDLLAERKISYADIDAQRTEISAQLLDALMQDLLSLGFKLTDFRIEGTAFDADTMTRINRIANVTAEARAAEQAGMDYAQLQQVEALREAARNEGGAAGAGVGIGAGIGLGQQLSQTMAQQMGSTAAAVQAQADEAPCAIARLEKLQTMHDKGLISDDEYATKKQAILDEL